MIQKPHDGRFFLEQDFDEIIMNHCDNRVWPDDSMAKSGKDCHMGCLLGF